MRFSLSVFVDWRVKAILTACGFLVLLAYILKLVDERTAQSVILLLISVLMANTTKSEWQLARLKGGI
ncbi:MAG: hypothetical protein QXG08_07945 [Candidatus Methanomethyliaceae archaeon]